METAKLCYMDTDRFVISIETENFCKDIANDFERWFNTSNYDENKTGERPVPVGKNKKVISLLVCLKMIRRKDYGRICCT